MSLNGFESKIIKAIQSIGSSFLDGFFRAVTSLAEFRSIFIFILFLFIFFGMRGMIKYVFILAAGGVGGLLIKVLTKRPRPFELFSLTIEQKATADGFSFISGHTITAVITAIYIYFLITKLIKDTKIENRKDINVWIKVSVALVLSLITLLIGFSRIYLGVHYISDVLFAVVFGILIHYAASFVYDKYLDNTKFLKQACLIIAAVLTVAAFIMNFDKMRNEELLNLSALALAASTVFFMRADSNIHANFLEKAGWFLMAGVVFVVLDLNAFYGITPAVLGCGLIFVCYFIYGFAVFWGIDFVRSKFRQGIVVTGKGKNGKQ